MFASFWGMAVLTPIYAYGKGNADGIYYLTIANVAQSSNKLVRTGRGISREAFLWELVLF